MSANATAMITTHRAAVMLAAVSSPLRLRLLDTVLQRQAADLPVTVEWLADELGWGVRELIKEVVRLKDAGLMSITGHRVAADQRPLVAAAEALVADLPITKLLRDAPELGRFFSYGRLTQLPHANRDDDRRRLAELLARLVPTGVVLTEQEVNDLLSQVSDDPATLRRFLVDHHQLRRGASSDYRRVSRWAG